jgi:hypothetical protein
MPLQCHINIKSDFQDAELYEMRFRQCMTRALTLVRVYFINSLKGITTDINQRISAKVISVSAKLTIGDERNDAICPVVLEVPVECRSTEERCAGTRTAKS